MKKYDITATYTATIYCGEVEANSKEEAIENAYQKGIIDGTVNLCWECSKKVDELQLDDESVEALEIKWFDLASKSRRRTSL